MTDWLHKVTLCQANSTKIIMPTKGYNNVAKKLKKCLPIITKNAESFWRVCLLYFIMFLPVINFFQAGSFLQYH